MLPVGLCEWKITTAHPIPATMINIRTFEAESLEIFKNIQPQSGWFVLPVGLYFRLVCASGWFVLPVGLCFRLVCANGK